MPKVSWIVIGIKTDPSVNDERPIKPITLGATSGPMSPLSTWKPLPVHRENAVEPSSEIRLEKRTISKALTPFSLQAILVPQMNKNWQMACTLTAITAFKRFVLIPPYGGCYYGKESAESAADGVKTGLKLSS